MQNKILPPYDTILADLEKAENEFFTNKENNLFNWDLDTITNLLKDKGFNTKSTKENIIEKRRITQKEIYAWFNSDNSSYANFIKEKIGFENLQKIENLLINSYKTTIFNWQTEIAFLSITM